MLIGEVGRDIIEENNDMLLLTPLKADLEYIANYILTPDHQARLLGKGTFGETFCLSIKESALSATYFGISRFIESADSTKVALPPFCRAHQVR